MNLYLILIGIIIGEIGTKLGMNGTNNGFLGFHDFRIPRENLLMQNSKVNFYKIAVRKANSSISHC